MDTELDDFKSRIDLREYAASLGYELDRRESSLSSSVMRAGGNKIIVKRNPNGHFVYFSVRDDADNGTIVDFLQRRQSGISLGVVRKELRPWVGRPALAPSLFKPLPLAARDREKVEREYSRMQLALKHPYLEGERCIPPALLGAARFAGRIRIDQHGNAVFPPFDEGGLCGFEKKNTSFTGFASGGTKGLWQSHDQNGDNCLVFAESAIDALSYAALFQNQNTRYCSIGGQVNPVQPGLIRLAIAELPPGASVVAAMDADDAGRKLAALVQNAVREVDHPDIAFRLHFPDTEGCDWNDQIRQTSTFVSYCPSPPLVRKGFGD